LQRKAKSYLWDLRLKNISFMYGDGSLGWADYAPFDGILVSAAPAEVPDALLKQLAIGGVLVIPVGMAGRQVLQRITRVSEDNYDIEQFDPVIFVPFLSGKE